MNQVSRVPYDLGCLCLRRYDVLKVLPSVLLALEWPLKYTQGVDNQRYGEVPDLSRLLTIVEEYLADYNAQHKSRMDLVLFL
jgi:hypothetical protein